MKFDALSPKIVKIYISVKEYIPKNASKQLKRRIVEIRELSYNIMELTFFLRLFMENLPIIRPNVLKNYMKTYDTNKKASIRG